MDGAEVGFQARAITKGTCIPGQYQSSPMGSLGVQAAVASRGLLEQLGAQPKPLGIPATTNRLEGRFGRFKPRTRGMA